MTTAEQREVRDSVLRQRYGLLRATLACAMLGALAAACGRTAEPAWHEQDGVRWRDVTVARGTPGFTRMEAGTTGITFQNAASEKILLGNRKIGRAHV